MAPRGRRMEHRQTVRHADAGPADRRSGVAEPRVRLLAQGWRFATGHFAGTAVARDRRRTIAVVDASSAFLRGPTSECFYIIWYYKVEYNNVIKQYININNVTRFRVRPVAYAMKSPKSSCDATAYTLLFNSASAIYYVNIGFM